MITFETISSLKADNMSWSEIGRKLNISPERARSIYRRKKEKQQPQQQNPQIKIHPEKVNWRQILEYAQAGQEISSKLNPSEQYYKRIIETNKPVIILFTGDWHLGASATNYESWRRDIEQILDTPNVFTLLLADEVENIRTFKTLSAVLSQVLNPQQQSKLLSGIIEELNQKKKILGKVTGNHDVEFEERSYGYSPTREIFTNHNIPVFSNRGILDLQVGSQVYSILGFHKSRFRSVLRPTHGAYQEWRFGYPADIVVGAHDHQPGFEEIWTYTSAPANGKPFGGQTFLIKIGTYSESEYGYRYFHNGGFPVTPCVVLYPNINKKVYFTFLNDAIQYTKGL